MENQQPRKEGKGIDWENLDCKEVRMNFQNEMNRKVSSEEKLRNGITWECLAKIYKKQGNKG